MYSKKKNVFTPNGHDAEVYLISLIKKTKINKYIPWYSICVLFNKSWLKSILFYYVNEKDYNNNERNKKCYLITFFQYHTIEVKSLYLRKFI